MYRIEKSLPDSLTFLIVDAETGTVLDGRHCYVCPVPDGAGLDAISEDTGEAFRFAFMHGIPVGSLIDSVNRKAS